MLPWYSLGQVRLTGEGEVLISRDLLQPHRAPARLGPPRGGYSTVLDQAVVSPDSKPSKSRISHSHSTT